jgi:hypothetical protein
MTTATVSTEELCHSMRSVNGEESGDRDEQTMRKPPLPTFGEPVSSLEVFKRYLCSDKINDASLGRLEHLQREREVLFIHHIRPTKKTSLCDYFGK